MVGLGFLVSGLAVGLPKVFISALFWVKINTKTTCSILSNKNLFKHVVIFKSLCCCPQDWRKR